MWRETGADIAKHASGLFSASPAKRGPLTPHVALASRLCAADPGREFLLGQRIPYVFVQRDGTKLQADKAEDPVAVLKGCMMPDYQLYFKNKMQEPLRKILEVRCTMSPVCECFQLDLHNGFSSFSDTVIKLSVDVINLKT